MIYLHALSAPPCACGCGAPVKPSVKRRGEWCIFASRQCVGRAHGKLHGPSVATRTAHRLWCERFARENYRRLVEVLEAYRRRLLDAPAVLEAVAIMETRAFKRGYASGRSKGAEPLVIVTPRRKKKTAAA